MHQTALQGFDFVQAYYTAKTGYITGAITSKAVYTNRRYNQQGWLYQLNS
jgi:hypothetical protein